MTLYAVLTQHGGLIDANLTAAEAAQAILNHDGQDYEIRRSVDGYDLWTRQQVAGRGWSKTVIYSREENKEFAEATIYRKVIAANWQGQPQAIPMAEYERLQKDAES